jgi:hypothetical protein
MTWDATEIETSCGTVAYAQPSKFTVEALPPDWALLLPPARCEAGPTGGAGPAPGLWSGPLRPGAKAVAADIRTCGFILDLLQYAAEPQSNLSKSGSEQLW